MTDVTKVEEVVGLPPTSAIQEADFQKMYPMTEKVNDPGDGSGPKTTEDKAFRGAGL